MEREMKQEVEWKRDRKSGQLKIMTQISGISLSIDGYRNQ